LNFQFNRFRQYQYQSSLRQFQAAIKSLLKSVVVIAFVLSDFSPLSASSKNLLPRMPELVIEKGYSDVFQVVECIGNSKLRNESVDSVIRVILKNVSDKTVSSSLKIRVLYLTSENAVKVTFNGKPMKFERRNPRIPFSLNPNEEVAISIDARQSIQYSLDAVKKENAVENQSGRKESKFALGDFARFFDKEERYGKRYMVGPLVSKWGVFPVDFKKVSLSIVVPADFDAVFPTVGAWKKLENRNSTVFTFDGVDGFSGAIFLPQKDVEAFKKIQSSLASDSAKVK